MGGTGNYRKGSVRWKILRKRTKNRDEAHTDPNAILKLGKIQRAFPEVNKKFTEKRLKEFLRKERLDLAEAKVVNAYVQSKGNISQVERNFGIKRNAVRSFLKRDNVRRSIEQLFEEIGLTMTDALSTVKEVMMRQGDYCYDNNRLKAVDMYMKMVGGYAPKKVKLDGKVDLNNKLEVRNTLIKMVSILKKSSDEEKSKRKEIKQEEVIPAIAERIREKSECLRQPE